MASEKTISDLFNNPIVKMLGTIFLLGIAYARFEYKIIKKIDEHIIMDGYEKQIQSIRIAQLEKKVDVESSRIDDIEYFIKPDAPEIKRKNYNRK